MRALDEVELDRDARLSELAAIFATGVQRLRKTELATGLSASDFASNPASIGLLALERSDATALSVDTEVNG
jgi:hypothetical protein